MNNFDENSTCAKCGWDNPVVKYQNPFGTEYKKWKEYLAKTYTRCGFVWKEETKDNEE